MHKTDAELKTEGFTNVTGYRDTFTSFDIWTRDALPMSDVLVRDNRTGWCTIVKVTTKQTTALHI